MPIRDTLTQREKRELDLRLDEELEGTFPASDPPKITRFSAKSSKFEASSVPHGLIEAILRTVSDAIIATDASGLISFWNPGAVRIFGFTAEEAVGSSLDLIIPENLRVRHWTAYNRVMATGESHYGQGDLLSVPGLTKDGRRISVEFTIVLLHDERRTPLGTAAILREVTKRFEETRELKRRLADCERSTAAAPR